MMQDMMNSIGAILPVIVLAAWACVLLLVDAFAGEKRKGLAPVMAGAGLLAVLALAVLRPAPETAAFNNMVVVDGFSRYMNVLLLVSGLAGVALAYDYMQRMNIARGEYYVLLLFTVCGMMLMGMSSDLIMVFLSLELLSIPLYVMAGIAAPQANSEEAAIKYFLLGSFSSGFLVFGTALVYGATGTTNLAAIVQALPSVTMGLTFLAGAALILIGLGFKVAVVPFHMWTPDVYQGAPTAVTAFMSVGAKAAGFAALLRIFTLALPSLAADMTPVLWSLAALTMILGNVVAISQKNIKRLLAYSSIAHAGYILMALVPYGQPKVAADSVASGLFYLAAYALTNFAAWAVVIALEKTNGGGLELDDYAGLGRTNKALATVMTIAMLSFTGVPPTLGFVGKFYLFRTVLEGGFTWLAIIGVLTSLISAFYYLRVVVVMWMQDGSPAVRKEGWLTTTAYLSAIGVVLLSLFSAPLIRWAAQAVLKLF